MNAVPRRPRGPAGAVRAHAAGETVLGTAGSDSVGLAAIAVANRIGAVPIATVRSTAKAEQLLDAGAAHVAVTGAGALPGRVREITGGTGLDVVCEAVAGPGVAAMAEVV